MESTSVNFGQYELVKRLARGGMAEIFLAIERGIEGIERQVVIKRILPQMAEAEDFVTMFMDEARVTSRFSHPNIAHVYNFGEVQGVYFLAMEYVDGITLSALMRQCRPGLIPVEMSLRIMADVCAGLHHAHEVRGRDGELLGVVHRDVSPQNIMISRAGMPKIIDFGVARATTQAHSTRAGQLKGKLGYIAPEQFHNHPLDRRADVFSVAVLLHESLTGERAFVRDSEAATVNAILHNDLPALPISESIPAGTEEIIQRAVAKDPNERYSTAYDMQAALEQLITESGRVVSPFVIGGFVSEMIEKARATKRVYDERMEIESLIPESYPSGEPTPMLELAPEEVGNDTDPSIALPASDEQQAPATVVTPPGFAQDSSYTSQPSYNASSVTPKPASDVPVKSRVGLIGVVIAVVLLMITGVSVGLFAIGRTSSTDVGALSNDSPEVASTAGLASGPKPTKTIETDIEEPVPLVPTIEVTPQIPIAADGGSTSGDAGHLKLAAPDTGSTEGIVEPSSPEAGPGPDVLVTPGDVGPTKAPPASEEVSAVDDEPGGDDAPPAPPGRLYLHTTPWSKVRIAGRNYGSTPLVGVSVPSGRHSLVLVDAEGRRHRRRVSIRPGSPTKLFIDMSKVGR